VFGALWCLALRVFRRFFRFLFSGILGVGIGLRSGTASSVSMETSNDGQWRKRTSDKGQSPFPAFLGGSLTSWNTSPAALRPFDRS